MTLQTPASFNPELATWLSQQGISLALSTYRANRLIFLGVDHRAMDTTMFIAAKNTTP